MLWEEKEEAKEPKLQWKGLGAVSHKKFFPIAISALLHPDDNLGS